MFPVRLVFLQLPEDEFSGVNVMVSASKRHFKRAVARNRVKRQLREYYRLNSNNINQALKTNGKGLLLALIFTDSKLWGSEKLGKRLDSAFEKLLSSIENSANF